MALVKKSWNRLVSKHYAWLRFPQLGRHCLKTAFVEFLSKFQELAAIDVPHFPGNLLTNASIQHLERAHSVGIRNARSRRDLTLLSEHPLLLSKLTELSLELEKQGTQPETRKCFNFVISESFLFSLASLRTLVIQMRGIEYSWMQGVSLNFTHLPSLSHLTLILSPLSIQYSYTPKICLKPFPSLLRSLSLECFLFTFEPDSLSSLKHLQTL